MSTRTAASCCTAAPTTSCGRSPAAAWRGETIAETVVREVQEETGLKVAPDRLVGIYTNPRHVTAYDDGEVRQQFSVCFACHVLGGQLVEWADESLEVGFFSPEQIEAMPMHPSIRLRITHHLEQRDQPVIA